MKIFLHLITFPFFLSLFFTGLSYKCYSQVNPDDIADLQLWLRADSLVDTTATGSLVTQWNDSRGIPLFVDQSNSTFQPSIQYNAINGYPIICFDGGDDFLSTSNSASLALYSGGSIFVVFKSTDAVGGILSRGVDSGTYFGWVCSIGQWDANNNGCFFVFGSLGNAANATGTVIADGNFKIYEIVHSSVNGTDIYLNSNLLVNKPYMPIGTITDDFNIAKGIGGNGYNYFVGDIAEIIIYDRALSDNERIQVEAYIAGKYSEHPVNLGADIIIPYGFCNTTLNAGSGFASYNWSTGEISQVISVDSSGIYGVTVTDNLFGISSYDFITVTYPVINLYDTLLCSGSSVTLSTGLDSTIGYTYLWSDFSTDSILVVYSSDNYSVTVTDGNSCSAVSDTIVVSEDDFPLTASLGNDDSLCVDNTIGLVAPFPLPQINSYLWSTSETTPEIAVDYPGGDYSLTVTDANGCTARDTVNIYIAGTAPIVHFDALTGCSGSSTQFTNTSNPQGTSWLWDFGDTASGVNNSSSLEDPAHVYASGGNYSVRLTVTDGICSNYLDSIIHISQSPVAAFTVGSACINNLYTFIDESTSNEGNITGWEWDFGDLGSTSDTSSLQSPTYTYTDSGNFNVTLIIITDSGCYDTIIHPITIVSSAPSPGSFTLIQPPDSFVTNNPSVYFEWNAAIGAVYYKLEYSTSPLFLSGVTSVSNIIATDTQQNIATAQQYYWKIIAYGICGDSAVSNIYSFTVFDTSSIPGMQLWLMGDSVDTLNNLVPQWYDVSGNNNDVTQSNTAFQPSFINSVYSIYDRPAISFNGSSSFMSNTNPVGIALNTGGSIFIVSKSIDNAGNIVSKIDDSSPNYGWTAGLGWWSGNYEGNFFVNGASSFEPNPAGTSIATDTFNIFEIIHSASAGTTIFKNAIQTNSKPYKAIDNNAGSLLIAKGIVPNANNYFSGDIAEIIVFNTALGTTDRKTIEDYLHFKYAPPVNLGPDIWTDNFCDTTLDASDRFISYSWRYGETTSSIQVNTGDTIWVDVVDVFGFPSSDTVIVHKPIVTAWGDTLCFGDSTTLNVGLSTPFTYVWEWNGDSTFTEDYVIHAGDTVNLHVYDNSPDSCSVDRQIVMVADSFPTLDLLGSSGFSVCTGDLIYPLCDTSDIEIYEWYDGTSYTYNEYFTVIQTSDFTLSLTATNARGCTVSDNIAIGIQGQQPNVGFNFTSVCYGTGSNTFDDTSTPVGMGVLQYWYWDFGNGDIDTLLNPALFLYFYTSDGIYDVTLTVETNQNCSKSITQQVPVYSVPVPAFSPLLGCSGIPLTLTDHSISPVGDVETWNWNFNDPNTPGPDTSTDEQPTHTYDSSGYDTIHLVVVTEYGCTDSIDQPVYIRPSPDVDFSYTSVCDGSPVYFTNETEEGLGIYQMYWDINGNIYTTYNPIFTFDGAGTYPVTLHVQSINGCTVDYTENVVVHAMPAAVFTPPDDICLSYPDTFAESSTVLPPDVIAEWEWDFDEFGTYYGQNPVITFAAEGDYPVILTVTSDAGCSNSITATVHVNPIPTADFLPDEYYGMPPITITFDNNSVDASTSYWEFGDGNISTLTDPWHIYTTEDTFTVMLVVTNSALCTDTAYQEIYIIPTTADVAVTDVVTLQQGEFLTVSAIIWNYGTRKIYELYLYAKASGGTMFMESWSDFVNPLIPMNSMPYTFNAQFAVPPGQSLDYVCVEAQIQNYIPDDVPENNEECITFNNNFSAFIPYPAPSKDEINIDFILPFTDQVSIDLYDIEGRLVEHIYSGEAEKGLNKLTFDISSLNMGVYVYRITFNEDFRILRFVKY
ncbi:MAG: PKD domain-containing protein [Bacteroidota bacterium]